MTDAPAPSLSAPQPKPWGFVRRFLFCFAFAYCLLFCLPMMFGYFPGLTVMPWQQTAFEERQKARTAQARMAASAPASAPASMPASSTSAPASRATPQPAPEDRADEDAPNAIVLWSGQRMQDYTNKRRQALEWVGFDVLKLKKEEMPFQRTGSGDTMQNYVATLIHGCLALAAAVLGALIPFPRITQQWGAGLLHWLVRWFLFMVMVPWYGFAKVIPTQFQPPGLHLLAMSWEDSSMMGVVWRFMGLSMPYTVFSGVAEILGGLLLVWRRTTSLGALVVFAVMTNVTAMNLCYDVPVKLYSLHYMVMALGLLLPDLGRLCNLLVCNRAAPARELRPFLGSVLTDRCATVFKLVLVAWVCYSGGKSALAMQKQMEERRAQVLAGVHQVESFTRDGVEVPPLATDASRWLTLLVEWKGTASVRMANGSLLRMGFTPDPAAKTVAVSLFVPTETQRRRATLAYAEPEPGVVELSGTLDGSQVVMRLRRREPGKVEPYTLHDRHFRWICELPFNR